MYHIADILFCGFSFGPANSRHTELKFFYVLTDFFGFPMNDGMTELWTKQAALSHKLIFIPVCDSFHYVLFVVVNPSAILEGRDSDGLCQLLVLDPMKLFGVRKQKKFAEEIRARLNCICGDARRPFTEDSLPLVVPAVPQQENSVDCGLFICKYFETMINDVNSTFCDDDELFKPSLSFNFVQADVTALRWEMIRLITTIHVEFFNENNRASDFVNLTIPSHDDPLKELFLFSENVRI